MTKWLQQSVNNYPKSSLEPSMVDLFIDFMACGPCRKNLVFLMPRWGVQKSKKSVLGRPRAVLSAAVGQVEDFVGRGFQLPPRAPVYTSKKTPKGRRVEMEI